MAEASLKSLKDWSAVFGRLQLLNCYNQACKLVSIISQQSIFNYLKMCFNVSNVLQKSSPTKACIVASIIFVLDKKTEFISAPHALVYFGIVIFFVYFKVQFQIDH